MQTHTTSTAAGHDDLVIEEFGRQAFTGPATRLCLASHVAPVAVPAAEPAGYAA
ncbi:hypothetical protein [Streptomyces sp. NPDC059788]|uniref:hypothetical protein n=1 Tax=Streptomyces sp. NPDC059788 TaxID=3346948 RepID=UPI00364A5FD2